MRIFEELLEFFNGNVSNFVVSDRARSLFLLQSHFALALLELRRALPHNEIVLLLLWLLVALYSDILILGVPTKSTGLLLLLEIRAQHEWVTLCLSHSVRFCFMISCEISSQIWIPGAGLGLLLVLAGLP